MAVRYYTRISFRDYHFDLMDNTYFEINGRMVDLLPKFRGTIRDKPLIHLRNVQIVCDALRPREVGESEFMIRMFPYSLTGYAKSWLFSLSVNPMLNWEQMRQLFLKRYSDNQHPQESTYEYLEYYKDFMATCPDISLPVNVLILNFLDGMNSHERKMMDVMAGGDIMECYPEDVWDLIYKRASQTKPYEPPESTYSSHLEDNHANASEWEYRIQETSDVLSKLAEPVPQVISIVPEERSLQQESASRPLAQTECITNPVAQTQNEETCDTQAFDEGNIMINSDDYLETVLEAESMEEVSEDKESKILPMPITIDERSMSEPSVAEEDEPNDKSLTLTSEFSDDLDSHAKDFIASQGIVGTCTTDFLIMPDYSLFSHVQVHELGVSFSVEKVSRSFEKICRKTMRIILGDAVSLFLRHKRQRHSIFGWKPGWDFWRSARGTSMKRDRRFEVAFSKEEMFERVEAEILSVKACKQLSNKKRTFRRENRNWKRRKKTKRKPVNEEVSLYGELMKMRHSNYLWKPGWDFNNANMDNAARKVRTSCNKFDGVHPWAPNL